MTEPDRSQHLKTLAETPARLKAAMKGVPKKLLLWTPGPGKWSILEILAHMRDMERDAYLGRYRRILAEDNPLLPDIDGDILAIREDYRSLNSREILKDWARLRKENLRLLKSVKSSQWARVGTHETAGPLSMDDLLRRHAVGNDAAHLGQIEGIRKRATQLDVLEKGPARVAGLVKSFTTNALRLKPASDRWSALEVICHLRDIERLWADRLVKTAFSERPAFYALDVDGLAISCRYNEQNAATAAKEFARLREDNLRLLRSLPMMQWQRTGVHPKRGEITIERMVETMIDHDARHVEQARSSASI